MTDENAQGQLSDEQRAEIENSVNAETFDLTEFLNNQWKFPRFTATIYLDGLSASRIAETNQEIDRLERELAKQERKQNKKDGSLGAPSKPPELVQVEQELEQARNQHDELAATFRRSMLKIVFQQQRPSQEIHRQAVEATKKKFPELSDKEREDSTEANEYHTRVLMSETIRDIFDHQGRRYSGEVTFEQIERLTGMLVGSESQKLAQNMMLALNGGQVMKNAADAGFPG